MVKTRRVVLSLKQYLQIEKGIISRVFRQLLLNGHLKDMSLRVMYLFNYLLRGYNAIAEHSS